jgi:hypothetical protein
MDDAIVRSIFQQGLGAIYAVAFLVALQQFRPLLGEKGLLPIPELLARSSFKEAPSLFHWHYSDRLYAAVCYLGLALSLAAASGAADRGSLPLSMAIWGLLWALYLSIVNTGQRFYGFGWESMLVEAGFFAVFLGPSWLRPSAIPWLCLRWMLFRTEFGAGLIKIRHDSCWRDCTCLYYHYETQPMPNPLSRHFHRLPRRVHRAGVVGSHIVQLIVPFGLFAPQPVAALSGAAIIAHQLWLIVSGNYSWLNWLTVVLGVSAFPSLGANPGLSPRPLWFETVLVVLALAILLLSVQPALNLVSPQQAMNTSYNSLRLVNAYGAFGSVTRVRYEVIVEGWTPELGWREYEFKAKPGRIDRRPPQYAPYHLRLDWLMWFLPFRARVLGDQVYVQGHEVWFVRMLDRLLENDPGILGLMAENPFPQEPPLSVRARYYRYRFGKQTYWERELIGDYYPARSLPPQRSA